MGLQTFCQKKRQWARNTLVFVSSRYANAFLRYCILNVFFFLHALVTIVGPKYVSLKYVGQKYVRKCSYRKIRMQMYVCKSTYGKMYVCQKYVCKSSYANVRKQMYVGYKVRMSKVRTQMFVRESSYAKVRMGIKYVRQKYVCKNSYANVRLQKCVRCKVRMSKARMQMYVEYLLSMYDKNTYCKRSCAEVHMQIFVRRSSYTNFRKI